MSTRYELILQQQKKNVRAYAVLCLTLVLAIGLYGYFKWNDYQIFTRAIEKNHADVVTLNKEKEASEKDFKNGKDVYDKLTTDTQKILTDVFPNKDNYTKLTKAFDAIEEKLNRAKNSFTISNIEYQDVQKSADSTYSFLPVRMTIAASPDNFTKFLQYVEESGSFTDGIRLMDIQSIHLSFNSDEDAADQVINFSVKVNAYFQNNT